MPAIRFTHLIAAGFIGMLLLLALTLGVSTFSLFSIRDKVDNVAIQRAPKVAIAQKLIHSLLDTRFQTLALLAEDEAEDARQKTIATILAATEERRRWQESLEILPLGDEERQLLRHIADSRKAYEAPEKRFLEFMTKNWKDSAREILDNEAKNTQAAYLQAIEALIRHQEAAMLDESKAAAQESARGTSLLLGTGGMALLLGLILAIRIPRSLIGTLGGEPAQARQIVRTIAAGNLAEPIRQARGAGDSVIAALGGMQNQLCGLVSNIRDNADQVCLAADGIAASANRVAAQFAAQNTAAASIGSSVGHLLDNTGQLAERTGLTLRSVDAAKARAVGGEQAIDTALASIELCVRQVSEAADSMSELRHRSLDISKMVTTVQEIAEQTNLLALNAAIEAARAGEAGRGFAVVADEVRKLADRTGTATAYIAELIGSIQQGITEAIAGIDRGQHEVARGMGEVRSANGIMKTIRGDTDTMHGLIGEISTGLQAQRAAAAEISGDAVSIGERGSLSLAAVAEASRAAAALTGLAENLRLASNAFRLP